MALCVYTARIDRKWQETATDLDTTMKSKDPLGRVFASDDPHMVFTLKRGLLSTAAYRTWYLSVLQRSYRGQRAHWEALLARPLVVLLCYCRPEQFCRRGRVFNARPFSVFPALMEAVYAQLCLAAQY